MHHGEDGITMLLGPGIFSANLHWVKIAQPFSTKVLSPLARPQTGSERADHKAEALQKRKQKQKQKQKQKHQQSRACQTR
jgi:hypothetical protein